MTRRDATRSYPPSANRAPSLAPLTHAPRPRGRALSPAESARVVQSVARLRAGNPTSSVPALLRNAARDLLGKWLALRPPVEQVRAVDHAARGVVELAGFASLDLDPGGATAPPRPAAGVLGLLLVAAGYAQGDGKVMAAVLNDARKLPGPWSDHLDLVLAEYGQRTTGACARCPELKNARCALLHEHGLRHGGRRCSVLATAVAAVPARERDLWNDAYLLAVAHFDAGRLAPLATTLLRYLPRVMRMIRRERADLVKMRDRVPFRRLRSFGYEGVHPRPNEKLQREVCTEWFALNTEQKLVLTPRGQGLPDGTLPPSSCAACPLVSQCPVKPAVAMRRALAQPESLDELYATQRLEPVDTDDDGPMLSRSRRLALVG